MVQAISKSFTKASGFETTVEYAHIRWFDTIELEGISIKDKLDSQLFLVHQLAINFDVSSFVIEKKAHLDEVLIDRAEVHMIRNDQDSTDNLNEFIKKIKELNHI